jgi:hypothetical protein
MTVSVLELGKPSSVLEIYTQELIMALVISSLHPPPVIRSP